MIDLPPQITESFVPITAGIVVSLINKYIINGVCCQASEPEEVDTESESGDTMKTELTDNASRTSAITTASLPAHLIHTPQHVYYDTHQ